MKTLILTSCALTLCLHAQPKNPVVQSGSAHVHADKATLEVHAADRTIIHWDDFSIQHGETTRFIQPSKQAAVLNRVTGAFPSEIHGTLEANGRVILINPHGIILGKEGIIRAADFIGSTQEIINLEDWGVRFDAENFIHIPSSTINHQGIIDASGLIATEGKILLVADRAEITGTLQTPGGSIEAVASHLCVHENAHLDVSSDAQGGEILLGGDLPNSVTLIGSGAKIHADARACGDGGSVFIWSQEATRCYGTITAQGGSLGGDGGVIEISSAGSLGSQSHLSTAAPCGTPGHILWDPSDITIQNTLISSPLFTPTYTPGVNAVILYTDIQTALQGSSTVTLNTTPGAGGTGVVQWDPGCDITWATSADLIINATDTITLNSNIQCSSTGSLLFTSTDGGILITPAPTSTTVFLDTEGIVTLTAHDDITLTSGALLGQDVRIQQSLLLVNPITLHSTNGDIVINALDGNTSANIIARDVLTMTADLGSIRLNADNPLNQGVIHILSQESMSWIARQNIEGTAVNYNGSNPNIFIEILGNLGAPSSFHAINGDISLHADAPNGLWRFSQMNSPTTFTVGRDFRLTSDSDILCDIVLGRSSIVNAGRNCLLEATGGGSVTVLGNQMLTFNIAGDMTARSLSNNTVELLAGIALDITAAGTVLLEKPSGASSFPNVFFGSLRSVSIDAREDVILGRMGRIGSVFGPVLVKADQNIEMGVDSNISMLSFFPATNRQPIVLVVDDQAPTAPQIGNGAFIMDPTAVIGDLAALVPVQIFTARQSQNQIDGLINAAPFIPGSYNIDTATEHWQVYYPNAFLNLSAPYYTIFYKDPQNNLFAIINQTLAESFSVIEEFAYPPPFYEDRFCVEDRREEPLRDCLWIQIDNYRKFYPNRKKYVPNL